MCNLHSSHSLFPIACACFRRTLARRLTEISWQISELQGQEKARGPELDAEERDGEEGGKRSGVWTSLSLSGPRWTSLSLALSRLLRVLVFLKRRVRRRRVLLLRSGREKKGVKEKGRRGNEAEKSRGGGGERERRKEETLKANRGEGGSLDEGAERTGW
eukprot:1262182-Rhodomonas_salina.1